MAILIGSVITQGESSAFAYPLFAIIALALPAGYVARRIGSTSRSAFAVAAIFAAVFVSHWSGSSPLCPCLMFWLGAIIARHFDKIESAKIPVPLELAALIASVGIIELSIIWHPGGVAEALLPTVMNAACLVVVAASVADGAARRALSTRPMLFLGKISYSLYPTHAIVNGGLDALLPKLGIGAPPVIAAISLVICMLFAVVFWRAAEVPSIDPSRSLVSHKPAYAAR